MCLVYGVARILRRTRGGALLFRSQGKEGFQAGREKRVTIHYSEIGDDKYFGSTLKKLVFCVYTYARLPESGASSRDNGVGNLRGALRGGTAGVCGDQRGQAPPRHRQRRRLARSGRVSQGPRSVHAAPSTLPGQGHGRSCWGGGVGGVEFSGFVGPIFLSRRLHTM